MTANEVMGFAHTLDTVVQSGATVARLLSIAMVILFLLRPALLKELLQHLPIPLMLVNVLMVMKVTASALMNLPVAVTGATVALASSIAFPPGFFTKMANQENMKAHVAVEVREMAIAMATFAAQSLASVARASFIALA